jgi:hypothetical protein
VGPAVFFRDDDPEKPQVRHLLCEVERKGLVLIELLGNRPYLGLGELPNVFSEQYVLVR